jgi:hypothetical protein
LLISARSARSGCGKIFLSELTTFGTDGIENECDGWDGRPSDGGGDGVVSRRMGVEETSGPPSTTSAISRAPSSSSAVSVAKMGLDEIPGASSIAEVTRSGELSKGTSSKDGGMA